MIRPGSIHGAVRPILVNCFEKSLDYPGIVMGAMQLPHFTLTKIFGNEALK